MKSKCNFVLDGNDDIDRKSNVYISSSSLSSASFSTRDIRYSSSLSLSSIPSVLNTINDYYQHKCQRYQIFSKLSKVLKIPSKFIDRVLLKGININLL